LANRWAEEPETGEQPKADLNPLLNPVLEENLGRWAQVYFTNPPEKRERAVMDLLRDLENHRMNGADEVAGPQGNNGGAQRAIDRVSCPICKADNRADERFCGLCGATLRAPQESAPRAVAPPPPAAEPMSFLGLSSTAPPENDLAFLREKSFEKSYYEPEYGPHRGRYIVLALLILVGGIGYLSWPALRTHLPPSWQLSPQARSIPVAQPQSSIAEPPASTPSQAAAPESSQPPLPAAQQSAQPPAAPEATDTAAGSGNQPEPRTTARQETQAESRAPNAASSRTLKLASDTQASRAAIDGTQELLLAQRYLNESHTATNRAAAARWLWKSVGKENPQAAMLLADLYTRGDGVSKSCDQARVLLGAAARKGLPDAGVKLRYLQSGGCR
jgi:hypothetical protein